MHIEGNYMKQAKSKKSNVEERDVEREGASSFIQPAILLSLAKGPTYGYELSQSLRALGMHFDGSTLYKRLRGMEKEGFVESHWHTDGKGPAKRFYTLTQEGADLLQTWMVSVEEEKQTLDNLTSQYRSFLKQCGDGNCGCGCGKLVKLEFIQK